MQVKVIEYSISSGKCCNPICNLYSVTFQKIFGNQIACQKFGLENEGRGNMFTQTLTHTHTHTQTHTHTNTHIHTWMWTWAMTKCENCIALQMCLKMDLTKLEGRELRVVSCFFCVSFFVCHLNLCRIILLCRFLIAVDRLYRRVLPFA